MRKVIFIFVLMVINYSLIINNTQAQWQADVRMTNDAKLSFTSFGNARCIAVSGNVVHAVWYSGDTVNHNGWDIFYKRSTDKGATWGAAVNLSNNGLISYNPAIAVSGDFVHVVWYGSGVRYFEEYYKRSTDGGITWGETIQLSDTSGKAAHCSIAASGLNVHIVWFDNRDGNTEIYYKKSIDCGLSWGEDLRLSNTPRQSFMPAVAVSGSVVHVAWYDSTAGNWEIYYKRSIDGGLTWGADTRLTYNSSSSINPSISVSGSIVHLVWSDNRTKTSDIYYKRSTNGGLTWGSDTRIYKSNYSRQYPSIAVEGSSVNIVWMQYVIGGPEIYYTNSVNAGVSWSKSETKLSNSSGDASVSSIAVLNGNVNVLWRDTRDGNWEIYYKRFVNAPKGNPTGITNNNSGIPNEFSLSQNYPNPFNPTTSIKFDLPKTGFVTLSIYDMLGREVKSLVNENMSAGSYTVNWNVHQGGSATFSSGIYFYKIQAGEFTEVKKMTLLK